MTFVRKSLHCAAFAALFLLLPFLSHSSSLAAEVTAGGDVDWVKLIAAAKKEGKVSVFLYQRENIEAAVKAFEKKYPEIQVVTASTPAAETGPRLMAERRAGKFLWDVCLCGPPRRSACSTRQKLSMRSSRR